MKLTLTPLLVVLPTLAAGCSDSCMNNFMCPFGSKRKSSPVGGCYDGLEDCDCIPGFYKSGDSCITSKSDYCNIDFPPFTSHRKSGHSCYNDGNDFNCLPGYTKSGKNCVKDPNECVTYECPAHSSPKPAPRTCWNNFDDCDCDPGFKKKDGMCVFDNACDTYPGSCTFTCPVNSYPDPAKSCIASMDDCLCIPHFGKVGNECVCQNTYTCPSGSEPIPNRLCYNDMNDCQAITGFFLQTATQSFVEGEAPAPDTGYTRIPLPIQTYYVPLPEDQIFYDTFETINSVSAGPITSMIAIAIGVPGTVIWYDDKNDGFESDVTSDSILSTTQIWGDGNMANGCAPGHPCLTDADDYLEGESIILLENEVNVDSPETGKYKGGDMIAASYPIAVTRGEYPSEAGSSPGSMLAGAVEMLDTSKWGTSFDIPVGTEMNAASNLGAFEYVGFYAMAMEDGTSVTVKDPAGATIKTQTLNKGESFNMVITKVGSTVTSSAPIQANVLAGDIGSTYEMRWFSLLPKNLWSNSYLSPVGDSVGDTRAWLYNPHSTDITVKFERGTTNPPLDYTVPAKGNVQTTHIPTGVGGYFSSTKSFIALSTTDTTNKGEIFDWGFPIQPLTALTNQVLIGWGYGCTGNKCEDHSDTTPRSVVWVSPVADAWCLVDFDGDKDVDEYYFVEKYASLTITDPDTDMSGAFIECFDQLEGGSPVNIASAWGQDPSQSRSSDDDALDLGTTVPNYPNQICTTYCIDSEGTMFDRCVNSDGTFTDTEPVPATTTDCTTVTVNPGPKSGGSGGDPHIKRWNRKPFMFHGECDLVLVHSDHVNGDKKLDVHIRTTIKEWWSQIDSAAMRVGTETVQFDQDKIIVNGQEYSDADLPIQTAEFVVEPPTKGDNFDHESRLYVVELTDRSTISFKIIRGMMNVFVSGSPHDFGKSVGLMGDYYLGKPYDREGNRMRDLEAFAFEWQVNPLHDPLLFSEAREPQLPHEKCRMPTKVRATQRKLRSDSKLIKQANEACANAEWKEACLSDILTTGMVELAGAW